MKPTGIVRRIDDLGRVVIPKEIRRALHMETGEPLELYTNKNGEIILKKYKKSWTDTVLEWWAENYDRPAMRRSNFTRMGDYTFCVLCKPDGTCMAGFAKRCFGDKDDDRVGKVAAFARAIGKAINELVGWKG